MAITKIKPVKSWLREAIEYITDPSKTDRQILISTFNCSHETAYVEFKHTLSESIDKGDNTAHHLMQAFKPGETTPEQAHEIGKRLADEVTKGKHEYVLTTHVDKGHIHNHIIFCAANFKDYRKYHSNEQSLKEIRRRSDRLCSEYGLYIVPPSKSKGKHYSEYAADRYENGSRKTKLCRAIDKLIPVSKDFKDLLSRLQKQGIEVKYRGSRILLLPPGFKQPLKLSTLGVDYTEENLKRRIAGEYTPTYDRIFTYKDFIIDDSEPFDIFNTGVTRAKVPYIRPKPVVNLIIDVQNCVKSQQSAGYKRWREINNLKELARTLNFLKDNGFDRYSKLEAAAGEVATELQKTSENLKLTEKRFSAMGRLIENLDKFQDTKIVYDIYRGLKGRKKDDYRKVHESDIIIHEAAALQLQRYADKDGRLPNPETLRAKYENLSSKRDMLRNECGNLKVKVRSFDAVKRNVDSILDAGLVERSRNRSRDAEL